MQLAVRHPVLRVRIRTEGPLAALGHDRIFEQPVDISVAAGAPDLDGAQVRVEGDLRKTTVLGAITAADRAEMLQRKDKDMFETARYPKLIFTAVYRAPYRLLEGTLMLHGAEQSIRLPLQITERDFGWAVEGEMTLDLRPFGIKPFKAMLGALRVAPEVSVNVSAEIVKS